MVHFHGLEYRSHTSCISEAQKYQGALYRPEKDNQNKKGKDEKRKSMNGYNNSQAVVPRGAYVEDAPEGDDMNAVALIDVPPKAPTPPPAPEALTDGVNVFDFLVTDATPKRAVQAPGERRMVGNGESQYSQYSQYSNGDGSRYLEYGFSYGNAPVEPSFERYGSRNNLAESQQSHSFVTPAPKDRRKEKKERYTVEKSDKKRKRNVEELDISSAKRPMSRDEPMTDAPATGGRMLHSGLTGGLSRLVTDSDFYDDRIEAGPTPVSPLKRSKREKDAKSGAKEERRKSSYVSYSTAKAPHNWTSFGGHCTSLVCVEMGQFSAVGLKSGGVCVCVFATCPPSSSNGAPGAERIRDPKGPC